MTPISNIPQRSCVACRRKSDKRDLLRVVRDSQGVVALDGSGRAPGRGAYLCHSALCLEKALKTKKLAQALRVDLTEQDCANLCCAFAEWEGGSAHGRN